MSEQSPRPQAAPGAPCWVVVANKPSHDGPTRGFRWRNLFRHPTEELANAECLRLAASMPGRRFTVYASGVSHLVEASAEKPAPVEVPLSVEAVS